MSPTTWTEKTAAGTGWQRGATFPGNPADDVFIDFLFEGIMFGPAVASFVENTVNHVTFTERTAPGTTWTERTAS